MKPRAGSPLHNPYQGLLLTLPQSFCVRVLITIIYVLLQWGGSAHPEPPHLPAATNCQTTPGAGGISHLGAKGFQTLFSGLKDEVPALKATDTRVDFTVLGRVAGGGGRLRRVPHLSALQPFSAPPLRA